jgi:hypothetical protein
MNKRGLTIAELMISLGILMIISSLMLVVTGTGRASWSVAAAKLYLSSQERQATSMINQELSLSDFDRVIIPAGGASVRFNIPLALSNGTLDYTAAGDLKWGDGANEGYSIEYFIPSNTTNLVKRILNTPSASFAEIAGSRVVIAHDVSTFNITATSTRQCIVVIHFSVDSYLGTRLPAPMNSDIVFYVTPMN